MVIADNSIAVERTKTMHTNIVFNPDGRMAS